MTQPTEHQGTAIQDPAWEARYHRIGFIVMFAILLVAPFVVYPVFLMKRSASRSSLRLQPAAGLRRPAVVRPRLFLASPGTCRRTRQGLGFPTELAILTGMGTAT